MALQRGITREESFRDALRDLPSDFDLFWGGGPNREDFEGSFLGSVFDGIDSVGQSLAGFVDAVAIIVEAVSAGIQVTLLNLGIFIDLFEGVIVAINLVLDSLREAISGTTANFLFHFPTTYKSRRTPSELMFDIGMSYLDKQDNNKPVSNTTNSAAVIVVLWSLPDLGKLRLVYDRLVKSLKGIKVDVEDAYDSNSTHREGYYLNSQFVAEGTSAKPDWLYGYSLADIGVFKKLEERVRQIMSRVDSKRSHTAKYNAIIDLINNRVSSINTVIQDISDTVESAITLFSLGDSSGIFICEGRGTNRDFAKALVNAPLHPDYPSAETLDFIDLNNAPSDIEVEAGREVLFSGAMAIHLQTVGLAGDQFNAVVNLFKKQRDQFTFVSGESPLLTTASSRINQIDLSTTRSEREES